MSSRRQLRRFAEDQGYTFADWSLPLYRRWHVAPFGVGYNRDARNVVQGRYREVPFVTFETWYSPQQAPITEQDATGSDRWYLPTPGFAGFRLSVAVLQLGAARLPDLQVVPTGWNGRYHGVTGTLPRVEVNQPDLEASYAVLCPDADFARGAFTSLGVSALDLSDEVADVMMLAIEGGDVVLVEQYHNERPYPFGLGDPTRAPEDSAAAFDRVIRWLLLIPDRIWLDRGGKPFELTRGMR